MVRLSLLIIINTDYTASFIPHHSPSQGDMAGFEVVLLDHCVEKGILRSLG